MSKARRILAFGIVMLAVIAPVNAQTGPGAPTYALVVAACGGQSLTPGTVAPLTMDVTGRLCTNGSGGGGGGANLNFGPDAVLGLSPGGLM